MFKESNSAVSNELSDPVSEEISLEPWKVLIVDDDESVHHVTRLVYDGFEFDGRAIEFLVASSAQDAKDIFINQPDIAVAIVDVVMETDQAGLELVDWVRNELNNKLVRLILRTGQPSEIPELEVIRRYEINDYKAKQELSSRQMLIMMIVSLRNYIEVKAINNMQTELLSLVEIIIDSALDNQSFDSELDVVRDDHL